MKIFTIEEIFGKCIYKLVLDRLIDLLKYCLIDYLGGWNVITSSNGLHNSSICFYNLWVSWDVYIVTHRVRILDSPTLLHKIERNKKKIKYMLTLFGALCILCIPMFLPLIWKKIKENKKSHAHHIYVALETVGLSSCPTIAIGSRFIDRIRLKIWCTLLVI